jgi:hypothetical protein
MSFQSWGPATIHNVPHLEEEYRDKRKKLVKRYGVALLKTLIGCQEDYLDLDPLEDDYKKMFALLEKHADNAYKLRISRHDASLQTGRYNQDELDIQHDMLVNNMMTEQIKFIRGETAYYKGLVVYNTIKKKSNTEIEAKDLKKVVQDPKNVVQDPKNVVQDPKKVVQDPKKVVQDPKKVVQDPKKVVQLFNKRKKELDDINDRNATYSREIEERNDTYARQRDEMLRQRTMYEEIIERYELLNLRITQKGEEEWVRHKSIRNKLQDEVSFCEDELRRAHATSSNTSESVEAGESQAIQEEVNDLQQRHDEYQKDRIREHYALRDEAESVEAAGAQIEPSSEDESVEAAGAPTEQSAEDEPEDEPEDKPVKSSRENRFYYNHHIPKRKTLTTNP